MRQARLLTALFVVAIGALVAGALIVPASARAGKVVFYTCDDTGVEPLSSYNNPTLNIDDWENGDSPGGDNDYDYYPTGIFQHNSGSFLNPRDGDYPGVHSYTAQNTPTWDDPQGTHLDVSGNSIDRFDHFNHCGSGGSMNVRSDDSGNPLPADGRSRGIWRWFAPVGVPSAAPVVWNCIDAPEQNACDTGWWAGTFQYGDQTGNNRGVARADLNSEFQTNPEAAAVFYHRLYTGENGTGFGSWTRKTWDVGSLIDNDVSSNRTFGPNQQIDSGAMPLNRFSFRVQCDELIGVACPNGPSDGDTQIRAKNVVLYFLDKEVPGLNWVNGFDGLSNTGRWHKGTETFKAEMFDGGTGVDHQSVSLNGVQQPPISSTQECWMEGLASPTTSRARVIGTSVFTTQLSPYSGGGRINFAAGPCPALVAVQRDYNTDTQMNEGSNTLQICADDLHTPDAQDPFQGPGNPMPAAMDTLVPSNNGNGDNSACSTRTVKVDNRSPIASAMLIGNPNQGQAPYQSQWIRGTVPMGSNGRDDNVETNDISGPAAVYNQVQPNNGAWATISGVGVPGSGTPQSSGTGTFVSSGNLNTGGYSDGVVLHIRGGVWDYAGNTGTGPTTDRTVDNTSPVDTTPQPSGSYANFNVNTSATDATSGIHHVECRLYNTVTMTTTTLTTFGDGTPETNCSYNITNQNDQVQYWYFDNAGNRTDADLNAAGEQPFIIDPNIDVSNPTLAVTGSSTSWFNTNRTLTLTATDNNGTIQSIYVSGTIAYPGLSDPTPGTPPTRTDLAANASQACAAATCVWNITLDQNSWREITFRARDNANNLSNTVTAVVKIDKVAPVLDVSNDGDGKTGWYAPAANAVLDGETKLGIDMSDPILNLTPDGTQPLSGLTVNSYGICNADSSPCAPGDYQTIDHTSYIDLPAPRCAAFNTHSNGLYECWFDSAQYTRNNYKFRSVTGDAAGNVSTDYSATFKNRPSGICKIE